MSKKTVYSYSPETGIYLGVATAFESPLEPNIYHIPAYATEIEPSFEDGKITKWNGEAWILENIPLSPEPTPPTLEESKEAKLAQITPARDAFMYSDIEYNGSTFTNSSVSGNNLTSALTIMGTTTSWLDTLGNTVVLTKAQAKELAGLMMDKRSLGYFQEASLITQINYCTTLEEVEAINISFE